MHVFFRELPKGRGGKVTKKWDPGILGPVAVNDSQCQPIQNQCRPERRRRECRPYLESLELLEILRLLKFQYIIIIVTGHFKVIRHHGGANLHLGWYYFNFILFAG